MKARTEIRSWPPRSPQPGGRGKKPRRSCDSLVGTRWAAQRHPFTIMASGSLLGIIQAHVLGNRRRWPASHAFSCAERSDIKTLHRRYSKDRNQGLKWGKMMDTSTGDTWKPADKENTTWCKLSMCPNVTQREEEREGRVGVETKPVSLNMYHRDIEKDRNKLLTGINCDIFAKLVT